MEKYINDQKTKKTQNFLNIRNSKDIVGHGKQIKDIKEWLNNYKVKNINNSKKIKKTSDYSCMSIYGNHGIGKTLTSFLVGSELGYDIYTINFSRLSNIKNIDYFVFKILDKKYIYNIVTGKKIDNVLLIIDNIESLVSPNEFKFIEALINYNQTVKSFPIIFVMDNKHNKFINMIKANTYNIQFMTPSKNNMMQYVFDICQKKSIKIDNQNVLDKIIIQSQNDFRRLLHMLQDIHEQYPKKVITETIIDDYINYTKKKDVNYDIFKRTEMLLENSSLSINDRLTLYCTEKTLMPLMIHQNYLNYLIKCKESPHDILQVVSRISKLLSKSDIIENNIYEDQNWNLQQIHGFLTCVFPTHIISQMNGGGHDRLCFPVDLNRTSIKHINNKNIKNSSVKFKDFNIYDIMSTVKIINHLLNANNIEQYKEIVKGYNADVSSVQSILKVDKVKNTKIIISPNLNKKIDLNT